MGIRRIRRQQRQVDMAESRRANGSVKEKERARRDARVIEVVKAGKLPYIPSVMSWLSARLDKPSTKIVQADIDKMLAPKP